MIDLTALNLNGAVPHLLDFGSEQEPSMGGASTRLDRLGNRHQIDVTVPPLEAEPDGRIWTSRLRRAKSLGARILFPQLDLDVGDPGAPIIAADVAGGTSISLTGLSANYVVREGQWLSITHAGRSFLYSSDADVAASSGGNVTLAITPRLRSPLLAGDAVNLAAPVIEGAIEGSDWSWTIDVAHHHGIQFSIKERA